jgi:DNA polymerase-3 subunit delta
MPELSYREFQAGLKGKTLAPIYLFHGEEDLLIEEGVESLIAKAIDPSMKSFNLDILYGSKSDARSVLSIAASFPMMSERRVVVVKEFEKLATNDVAKDLLASYIQRPLESTCLILISPEPDFRKKPYPQLKKVAQVVECRPLYDNNVPSWIADRVKSKGKEIDVEACQLLQAYSGNSLRAIQNEIEKLFVFVGDRKSISVEDVSQVVGETRGFTVFDLQNAVGRRDMKEAVKILERMLDLGESPQLIIVMLTRFFQQLWKLSELKSRRLSESQMAAELKVHPYYLKQYLGFAGKFTIEHVEKGFSALLQADTEMKSTGRDPRLIMDLLLYSLVRGSAQDAEFSA